MIGSWRLNNVSFRFKEDGLIEIITKDIDVVSAVLKNQNKKAQHKLDEMTEMAREIDSLRKDLERINSLDKFLKMYSQHKGE